MSKKEEEKVIEKEVFSEKDFLKNSKARRQKRRKPFKSFLKILFLITIILFLIIFFKYLFIIYFKNKKNRKFKEKGEILNITNIKNITNREIDLIINENKEVAIADINDELNIKERPIEKRKYDYNNTLFKIIYKKNCQDCDFFTYYINFLGCIITSITSQRTPIIDVRSYPNIFNENNTDDDSLRNGTNYWENLFYHPHNYTLKEIEENAQKLEYEECENNNMVPNQNKIYYNKYTIEFYHNFAYKFLPIKLEILKEAYIIKLRLFRNSNNILGVLTKGSNATSLESEDVPNPPKTEIMIKDVIKIDDKNKYDYIFLVTQDKIIRNKFIKKFGEKLKYLEPENKIEYNDNGNESLSENKNTKGFKYQKFHLINIIILSKCLDIISPKSYDAAAAFILSEGFRNSYLYNKDKL